MDKLLNEMQLRVLSKSLNEAFVRGVVAAFCVEVNPTIEEIDDIKTAVSEVITNSIVHGYDRESGYIDIQCNLYSDFVDIVITDYGKGIIDIKAAMQPFFTTRPEDERSGMGFTIVQSFMSSLDVTSTDKGTTVRMSKIFNEAADNARA